MSHRSLTVLFLLSAGCPPPDLPPLTTDTAPTSDLDRDGFSIAEGDCDDDDANSYPGATDVVGDGIDQNCDDLDGVDEDEDGHASIGTGGNDCNDADDTIYTGAPEVGWDAIDQNCDYEDQYDFSEIGGGRYHTCGLDTQGVIRCWGGDTKGEVSQRPLDAEWKHVCSGDQFNCAVHEDGRLTCWGSNTGDNDVVTRQVSDAPTDKGWDQVTCGFDFACALNLQGQITCWGSDDYNQVSDAPASIDLVAISGAHDHACGITRNLEKLVCWGRDDPNRLIKETVDALNATQFDGDEPAFLQIASGADHTCAIRRKGFGLDCFGLNTFGQASPLNEAGPYNSVGTRFNTTCGTLEATDLSCWGDNNFMEVSSAPITSQSIRTVGMGFDHGCGIRKDDGEVVCWGRNLEGQATVPVWGP